MSLPTLRHLQCFLAVAEELNFRAAADRLHMSQPPLTRQIQSLEGILGVALFVRDSKSVVLTPAGQALVGPCREVMEALEKTVSVASSFGSADRHVVRLGMTTVVDVAALVNLPALLSPLFAQTRGSLDLSLSRAPTITLMDRLRQGALDAAIIGLPIPVDDGGDDAGAALTVTQIYSEPLTLALAQSHPVARDTAGREAGRATDADDADGGPLAVDLRLVKSDPLFWFPRREAPGFYDYCETVFHDLGYTPSRCQEPPEHTLLMGALARNEGVALLPQSLSVLRHPGVAVRPLIAGQASRLCVRLGLARRREDPVRDAVWSRVADVLRDALMSSQDPMALPDHLHG